MSAPARISGNPEPVTGFGEGPLAVVGSMRLRSTVAFAAGLLDTGTYPGGGERSNESFGRTRQAELTPVRAGRFTAPSRRRVRRRSWARPPTQWRVRAAAHQPSRSNTTLTTSAGGGDVPVMVTADDSVTDWGHAADGVPRLAALQRRRRSRGGRCNPSSTRSADRGTCTPPCWQCRKSTTRPIVRLISSRATTGISWSPTSRLPTAIDAICMVFSAELTVDRAQRAELGLVCGSKKAAATRADTTTARRSRVCPRAWPRWLAVTSWR